MAASDERSDQLASGVIDLLVLRLLADGENYVYVLTAELVGHGLKDLRETTVYTAVKRLERSGLLQSRREVTTGGRPRRYYSLTEVGRSERQRREHAWRDLTDVVVSVLGARSR